jgi:hypothetical protein
MAMTDNSWAGHELAGMDDRGLRLTAAVYAAQGVADLIRQHGHLPRVIEDDGWWMVPALIGARGVDLRLTADEQLVYDALRREGRLPGVAVLVEADGSPALTPAAA